MAWLLVPSMLVLVTAECPPTCPVSGSHRCPRASTNVEGPAAMRVTQDVSGLPRSSHPGSRAAGRAGLLTCFPLVRAAPAMSRPITATAATYGRQRRTIVVRSRTSRVTTAH